MNPLILAALLHGGGGLLGGLFGGGAARRNEQYRRQLMQLLSPQNLMNTTRQLYGSTLASPAYSQAQRGALASGNALQNNLAASLGARGLGTTGTGAIAQPLAASSAANQLGNLRTSAWNMAGQQSQDLIGQQVRALMGLGAPGSSPMAQSMGGALGGFNNFLTNYMLGGSGAGGGGGSNAGVYGQPQGTYSGQGGNPTDSLWAALYGMPR